MPAWIGYAFVGLASVFAGWSGWVFYDRVINTDEDNNNASGGTASSVEATGNVTSSGNDTSSGNEGLVPSTPVSLEEAAALIAETNARTQTTTTDRFLNAGEVDSITFTVSDDNGFSTSSIIEQLEKEAADFDGQSLRAFEKSTVNSTVTGITQHFAKTGIYKELEVTISGEVRVPQFENDYGYHETYFTMYDDDGYYSLIGYEYQVA